MNAATAARVHCFVMRILGALIAITDERLKQLMESVSNSLMQALRQCDKEARLSEREKCAKIAERYEPDEKLDRVAYASRDIRSL